MNIYEYFLTKNKENSKKIAMSSRLPGGDIKSYTYRQLFDKVDIFGGLLSRTVIELDDRVAVDAENCPEWCAAYLAIAKLRATAILIDASLEREELCRLLDKSKVRCICTTPKTFEKLDSFSGISVINILNNAGFFIECKRAAQTADSDENISTIIFSSCTTKAASGIMHSHESMLSTSKMIEKCLGVKYDDKSPAVVPNSHIYGLITQVIIPLYLGASVCYLESITGDMITGTLHEFQPTFLPAVPKMYELFKSQIMRKINGSPKTQKAMIPVDRCGFVNDAFEAVCGKLKATHYGIIHQGKMIQDISAEVMDGRCQVFTSIKTKDMQGAGNILKAKYGNVREEEGYLRVYDVDDTKSIVDYLLKNGHVVSEIKKNKIGLEEYYIELMQVKEAK